jgi:hypothetical protein
MFLFDNSKLRRGEGPGDTLFKGRDIRFKALGEKTPLFRWVNDLSWRR